MFFKSCLTCRKWLSMFVFYVSFECLISNIPWKIIWTFSVVWLAYLSVFLIFLFIYLFIFPLLGRFLFYQKLCIELKNICPDKFFIYSVRHIILLLLQILLEFQYNWITRKDTVHVSNNLKNGSSNIFVKEAKENNLLT